MSAPAPDREDAVEPVTVDMSDLASQERDCRRCGEAVSLRFPGLCPSCTAELRARYDRPTGAAEISTEYVPKMNVTPNAVALRDD